MSNTYIKFKSARTGNQKTPENIGKKLPEVVLETIAPTANPDFEKMIDAVATWLIEFEGDSYFPDREIGLNNSDEPVMVMPWGRNYGYWTDNNLTIKDFRANFDVNDISRAEFEGHWKFFESSH